MGNGIKQILGTGSTSISSAANVTSRSTAASSSDMEDHILQPHNITTKTKTYPYTAEDMRHLLLEMSEYQKLYKIAVVKIPTTAPNICTNPTTYPITSVSSTASAASTALIVAPSIAQEVQQ